MTCSEAMVGLPLTGKNGRSRDSPFHRQLYCICLFVLALYPSVSSIGKANGKSSLFMLLPKALSPPVVPLTTGDCCGRFDALSTRRHLSLTTTTAAAVSTRVV